MDVENCHAVRRCTNKKLGIVTVITAENTLVNHNLCEYIFIVIVVCAS